MRVAQGFAAENVVAIFDEPTETGDFRSIDAPRNAPAKNPAAHLSSLFWHSDFFQYELAFPLTAVSKTHSALAGGTYYSGVWSGGAFNNQTSLPGGGGILTPAQGMIVVTSNGQVRETEITLVQHDLGYVPVCYIAYEGRLLLPGTIIQTLSNNRSRVVTAFATSSVVGLLEIATSSEAALPAVSRSYEVMVFRNPEATSGRPLMGMEGNNLIIGRGKVDSSKQYLRRVRPGESNFDLDRGRTVDLKLGKMRQVSGGVTTTESGYSGSFTGPAFTSVGV